MRKCNLLSALALLIPFILIFSGCSGNNPDTGILPATPETVDNHNGAQSQAYLWGFWEFDFNPDTLQIDVIPYRESNPHFDVTQTLVAPACSDCVSVSINSFNPGTRILDADISLRNPSPLAGYDVRGILYTDNSGHLLKNPDGWTNLFDIPGGQTINPFIAYAKEVAKRKFNGMATHMAKNLLYIPKPPEYNKIKFAVTASWPGNAKEPYQISNFTQTDLLSIQGSYAKLTIDVLDWQNDVNKVTLAEPDITGEDFTQFSHTSGNTWELTIQNNMGAPAGDYNARIIATSDNSGNLPLYDFVNITINEPTSILDTWGGSDADDARFMATDSNGNIFVTGIFIGMADLDPGPGTAFATGVGLTDVYLTKFDSDGNYVNSHTWGGIDYDYPGGVAVDDMGNVYVGSNFIDQVDFDGMGDIHKSEGNADAALTKFDNDLNYQYTITWGGLSVDYVNDIKTGIDGSIYAGGYYGATADFDPSSSVVPKTSNGLDDSYLAKYNPDGELIWVEAWGGTQEDHLQKISVAMQGSEEVVYGTGYYWGLVEFGNGLFGQDEYTSKGAGDVYMVKYSGNGVYQFALTVGSSDDDKGQAIASTDNGAVVFGGFFSNSADLNPFEGEELHEVNGLTDIFMVTLENYGATFYGAYSWGGVDYDFPTDLNFDSLGNLFISGYFADTTDFDPGVGNVLKSPNGSFDCFISKFDPAMNFQMVITWGGSQIDAPYGVEPQDDGSILAAGVFRDTVDFDPGPGEAVKSGGNSGDAFLVRYEADGSF